MLLFLWIKLIHGPIKFYIPIGNRTLTRLLQSDECHTTVTIQISTIRITGNIFQFLVRDTSAGQDKTKDFLAALDVIRAEINHADPTDLYLIA